MTRAVFPGSFDPLTNGHLDIIQRSCRLFDEMIVAILVNPEKNPLFSVEERLEMIREVVAPFSNVRVDQFNGLLVNYAAAQRADCIVRGIRAVADYEYELQMALMNRRMQPDVETLFLMSADTYSYVSSRLVKEVFMLGRDVTGLVPPTIEVRMRQKLQR
ncbi:MAG: pantetheine-phosphate adenylyltransferase [Blastocatellia bacterium]|nr:pantetheine-phosphate adenylyltransferase [Blastocatellia bacterium]